MENQNYPEFYSGWTTVQLLGRGSFGKVYEIQRNLFGTVEKAALKVISIPNNEGEVDELYGSGYDDLSITAHFQNCLADIVREYNLMASIKGHTNIVYCDDIRYVAHKDTFGWDIYIKMELLTPLMKSLNGPIRPEMVRKLGMDLCSALVQCKTKGIVHRDIKPQNIFVSEAGDFKLGDFGIAKTIEQTTGGTKIGTLNYMSPEVYNNQPYGASSDLYALGMVMYWLLNERRLPFLPMPPKIPSMSENNEARERRLGGDPIPAPKNGGEELKAIVMKACAYNPRDRYQSAQEMLEALKNCEKSEAFLPSVSGTSEEVFSAADGSDETVTIYDDHNTAQANNQVLFRNPEQNSQVNILDRGEITVLIDTQPDEPNCRNEIQQPSIDPHRGDGEKPGLPDADRVSKPRRKKGPIIVFVVAVAILIGLLVCIGIIGMSEPSTTAVVLGNTEIDAAMLNYYYIDQVQTFHDLYGSYCEMFGLNASMPLNGQFYDESAQITWADHFLNEALTAMQENYGLAAAAQNAGFALSGADTAFVESAMDSLADSAERNGYADSKAYLKAKYGEEATVDGYREYLETAQLAKSYYAVYYGSMVFSDEVLRDAERDSYHAYSSFSYSTCYLSADADIILPVDYIDPSASFEEEIAKFLVSQEIADVQELDEAIGAMVNDQTPPSSITYENRLYSTIEPVISSWLADPVRKPGDITCIPDTNENGTAGYHIVLFTGSNDNTFALRNARHILVKMNGGTADENGVAVYSQAEKDAALDEATKILAQWMSAEATEESFAKLANEKSDEGNGTTGGLYENIFPGQMVSAFDAWCFDSSRVYGDTGIIETEYGYHVMFYSGESSLSYRDYLITNDLRSAYIVTWLDGIKAGMPVTVVDITYVPKSMTLGSLR